MRFTATAAPGRVSVLVRIGHRKTAHLRTVLIFLAPLFNSEVQLKSICEVGLSTPCVFQSAFFIAMNSKFSFPI